MVRNLIYLDNLFERSEIETSRGLGFLGGFDIRCSQPGSWQLSERSSHGGLDCLFPSNLENQKNLQTLQRMLMPWLYCFTVPGVQLNWFVQADG